MGEPGPVIEFDQFELDLARFELRHRGVPVPLERQVFDVLAYLVRAQGRVVTKEELLDEVWGTRFVTESALTTQIKFARKALGDDGTRQRYIRTVHRRGYEFVADPALPADDDRPPLLRHAGSRAPAALALARDQATRLVGRDGALADLVELLTQRRLVTVTGPGGVGKTRLALAAAGAVAPHFDDGVVVIDLATVSDPTAIARVAAEAAGLGLREGAAVADALAESDALVLLDNCEHLVDGVADFVERLLARPQDPVRVLTTSREPLAVLDEEVFPLGPLGLGGILGQPSPAARLFLDRSGRAARDLDVAQVERLVELLDGLPLAIELAAAQVGFMSLSELQRRLEQHRFTLAHDRRRSGRHDSLAASVAWSWQLLDDDERTALTELSVFPGDFGLDAVDGVVTTPDPLGALRRLHAKSLVARSNLDDTTRFRLLFGVRDFVRPFQGDLAGGPVGLRRRLAGWFGDWLDEWSFEEQWASAEFLDVLLTERATLREVATVDEPAAVVGVARVAAASAATYRYGIGVAQGRTWAATLAHAPLAPDLAARVAIAGSEAAYAFGDVTSTHELAEAAFAQASAAQRSDLVAVALTQQCIGRMLVEPERCAGLLTDAARHARDAGTRRIESIALGLLGFCVLTSNGAGGVTSGVDVALATAEDADRLAAPSGWDRVCVATLRGTTHFLVDDRVGAADEFDGLATSMAASRLSAAAALFHLLAITCRADSATPEEVRAAITEFLREYRRATGHAGRADALLLLAQRAARTGDIGTARRLVDALRGRRLAHQVSQVILRDLAARIGTPIEDLSVPSVAVPQSVPALGALLESELAALV